MEPRAKQGLFLGLIVGIFVFIGFFFVSNHNWMCIILVPICAIMGCASQMIKPADEDDD